MSVEMTEETHFLGVLVVRVPSQGSHGGEILDFTKEDLTLSVSSFDTTVGRISLLISFLPNTERPFATHTPVELKVQLASPVRQSLTLVCLLVDARKELVHAASHPDKREMTS